MPYAEDIGIRSGTAPRKRRKSYVRPPIQAQPGPITPSEQRTIQRAQPLVERTRAQVRRSIGVQGAVSDVARGVQRGARKAVRQQQTLAAALKDVLSEAQQAQSQRIESSLGIPTVDEIGLGLDRGDSFPYNQRLANRAIYKGLAGKLWEEADRLYGQEGKRMPRLNIVDDFGFGAYHKPGERSINVGAPVAEQTQFGGGKWYGRSPDLDYARAVPLHEWAHVFQSNRWRPKRSRDMSTRDWIEALKRSKPILEGGAEAFEQLVAPEVSRAVGVPFRASTNRLYAPWARAQRQSRAKRQWVRRGQFR